MRAQITLDDNGNEQLTVECDNCPDGTQVKLHGQSATAATGKVALPLKSGLSVGENVFKLAVERPGMGRDEQVQLVVPVEYRVRGDFSAIDGDPPELRVAVEARPGTTIVIDGKAVTLDGSGKGSYSVDISEDVSGTSDAVAAVERKLPYTVTPPNGTLERGEVTLRVGVAPLRIDAPGPRIVVEEGQFMLSGRTAKDGTLQVAGRPITVDGEGRFSQLMNVSSVGQTTITVRAAAKDLAPRLAKIEVKRVGSLEDEARKVEPDSIAEYDEVGGNIAAHEGKAVAWSGKVVEARARETTIVLLDVESGCEDSPCLTRLLYGQKRELAKDTRIRVYGRVGGAVEGPRTGHEIPEIRVDFMLDGPKG
jgi:hypothetical protein